MTNDQNPNNKNTDPREQHGVARDENLPDLSERILDKGDQKETPEELSKKQVEKLKMESEENTKRSDNQEHSDRILDKEEEDV